MIEISATGRRCRKRKAVWTIEVLDVSLRGLPADRAGFDLV
jgi:hypothetical protein